MKAYKLALPLLAATTLLCTGAGVAYAQEPADCGAANVALQSAKSEHDKAVDADEKAEKAKDADNAFDRADRDLRQAERRLERITDEIGGAVPTEAQAREKESAEKAVDQATKERDRARKQADKENAAQLQRVADRTDADELKRRLDEAQADVNRLCGGVTTTPSTPAPDNDVDCDEVGSAEAQRILDADRSDPNNLDQDNDNIACEIDEILPEPDDDDVVINNNVVTPGGGIETGIGPRDS